MKRITNFLLLSIFLASCANAETPAPTVTGTVEATVTLTSTPTEIPTSTEIPSTPTITPDPNAPEGYSRFENGVYYLDKITEKGNTITGTWDPERKAFYWTIFSGYGADREKVINDRNNDESRDFFWTDILVDMSITDVLSIPTLSHPDNSDPMNTRNFSMNIQSRMIDALIEKNIISGVEEYSGAALIQHKYFFNFENANGPQSWDLGSDITVHIRSDYNELKENMATNGFSETQKRTDYGPVNSYIVKFWTDENNNGYLEISPSLPASQWTEAMFYEMAFMFEYDLFESTDLTHPQSGSILSGAILGRETFPFFEFGPSQ